MSEIIINDKRRAFKITTFSNYKKTDVIKKLTLSLYYGKLEESFFWTCELLCTNLIIDLWNTYFLLMSKYIHVYNPKLPLYLNKKFQDFKQIAMKYGDDFKLRNDNEVRLLFCSVTLVLCYSQKYTILDDLNYKFDFKIENLYENLKAPNVKYIEFIYLPSDPKEYTIPFNELIYHLRETKSKTDIHFWINWIIQYDILCRKKKKLLLCQQRDIYMDKNEKYSKNIIWIVWDILLKMSKKQQNQQLHSIIQNIFDLFSVRYTFSYNKKRIHQIYHVIELLLLQKQVEFSVELLKDRSLLSSLEQNIQVTFEQIKKHEQVQDEEPKSLKEKKMDLYKNIYNNLSV
tara:strand:+ start:296 stop:1327 length:1032 start_codon:yes stop_codon:yes gene_type:complete